jgi:lysophospholipase
LRDFLARSNITGFNVGNYFDAHASDQSNLPNIGIAVSGGGYRALMVGAGALAAFDSRTSGSTASGHLGGLLQSATYLTGLSGGSWLVGSMYGQNFASIQDLLSLPSTGARSLWQFDDSIFKGMWCN